MSYFAIDIANEIGHFQFFQKAFVFALGFFLSSFDLSTAGTYGVKEKETKTLPGTQVTPASPSRA